LETLLAFEWLRFGMDIAPGFMFWRNEALTKLVLALFPPKDELCNLGRDFIKNVRQNLRLIPVSDAACCIWDVKVSKDGDGAWHVCGKERNGKLVFRTCFRLSNPG
jgi:hypothetical protein